MVANELRRRGYDVEAFGNNNTANYTPFALSMRTEAAWLDKDGNIPVPTKVSKVKSRDVRIDKRGAIREKVTLKSDKDFVKELNGAMSEEGRYHISWSWSRGNVGHIITAERIPDGSLRIYDPQNGKITSIKFKDINVNKGFEILRVDNLNINFDVVRGVIKKAGMPDAAPLMDDIQKKFWKKNGKGSSITGSNKLSEAKDKLRSSNKMPISQNRSFANLNT